MSPGLTSSNVVPGQDSFTIASSSNYVERGPRRGRGRCRGCGRDRRGRRGGGCGSVRRIGVSSRVALGGRSGPRRRRPGRRRQWGRRRRGRCARRSGRRWCRCRRAGGWSWLLILWRFLHIAPDEDHSRHDDHERGDNGRADYCPAAVGVEPLRGPRVRVSFCR